MSRKRLTDIFFIIGVVAVIVMLLTFEVSFAELWCYLCDSGWWLVPILGIWVVIYGLNALSWGWIVRSVKEEHQSVPWSRIYKLTVSGYALNYSTPVAGLGGEPYRIVELGADIGNERATSSVILYVMTHILAHVLFWIVGLAIYFWLAAVGLAELTSATLLATSVTLAVIVLLVCAFWAGYRHGLVMQTVRGLTHLPGLRRWGLRLLRRHGHAFERVDTQIRMLHSQDRRTFYGSLGLEFLSRFVQSLEILFMLILFDYDHTGLGMMFLQSVFILTVATILSNLLGFMPMQLGSQEGGFVLAIAMLGLPPALGIFICIICRVREIAWIVAGLALMKKR